MSTAAQQLAQWIELTHPDFFEVLFSHVQKVQGNARLARARLRGFGQDDGEDDLSFFTPTYDAGAGVDTGSSSLVTNLYSPATVDIPTLTSTDLQAPAFSAGLSPTDSGTLDVSTDNSGSGVLQSIGSGIASAATSVGSFLTSAQGLSDVTKLATAFFQVQNTKATAQLQTQLLQAQAQRTALGQSPAPITYAVGANGQLVPVYVTSPLSSLGIYPSNMPAALQNSIAAGQSQLVTLPDGSTGYTVPSNIVGGLSATALSGVLPWILLIGGGLLLLKEISR